MFKFQIWLGTILVFVLASCSSNNPIDNGGGTPQNNLTEAQVKELAPTLARNLNALGSNPQNPFSLLGGLLGGLSQSSLALENIKLQQENCIKNSGNAITYNCTSTQNGISSSIKGTMVIEQLSNGYHVYTQPTLVIAISGQGQNINATFDFDTTITQTGNSLSAKMDMKFVVTGSENITMHYKINDYTFVSSSSAANPFSSGTLTINGSLSFSGNGKNYSFTMKTDPNLVYSQSCSTGVTSGAVIYTLGNDTLRVVVNGCNNTTATLNGKNVALTAN